MHALKSDMRGVHVVVPAVKVLVEEVIVLLMVLPNTADTLTVQLLPALREELVCILSDPGTKFDSTDCNCESHNN